MDNNILYKFLKILSSFMILLALFYFFFKYSICKLFSLNKKVILNKLYLDDIVSLIISILILFSFFKLSY